MKEYRTIKEPATGSLIERKSEFIGYAAPVSTEEAAISFIGRIKKKHSDARHNVYAYILQKNNITRFSDDGEPHGTAGLPVLELLRKEELTDIAVVVTRYFGGILLGAGGLVRAYTSAANSALNNAEKVIYKTFFVFSVELEYSDYPKTDYLIQNKRVKRDKTDFGTRVRMQLAAPQEDYESLIDSIMNATGGRCEMELIGERFDYTDCDNSVNM
jgi:uncharacterized YigZ family protein